MMSECSDSVSATAKESTTTTATVVMTTETDAQRRARIRREKILLGSNIRMNRILSMNDHKDRPNNDNNKTTNSETISDVVVTDITGDDNSGHKHVANNEDSLLKELPAIGQIVTQKAFDFFSENSELRHRLNANGVNRSSVVTSQTFETTNERQSIDRTFPRKVSLISTPIDYRTLQQSHQNNTTTLTSHLVWMLSQNHNKLLVIGILIFVALVASMAKLNFILPFLVTQLFRFVIVATQKHKTSNSSNRQLDNIWIAVSVFQHLTIFVFVYIMVQILV